MLLLGISLAVIQSCSSTHNFADVACGRINYARRNPKVVGGENAIQGEFPWLVSVTRRGGHFCGGSLLTNRHVLTAGHCMCSGIGTDMLEPASIKITIGQHDLSKTSENAYEMSVKTITVHPDYSCAKARNDIAILELEKQLSWSTHVSPACLPTGFGEVGYDKYANILATVAGWGWTNEISNKGKRAKILQKAKVNVLETETCREWYKSQGKKTKIQESQMCAGFEQGGIDACWADSGGPLMVVREDRMVVVGVVSTGIGCARPRLPGLYTRISEFIPWIQSVLST